MSQSHPGLGAGLRFFNSTPDPSSLVNISHKKEGPAFSGAPLLAKILESENAGPLTVALKAQGSFTAAYNSLTSAQKENFQKQIGQRNLEEFLALSQEKDPTFFYAGLMNLGIRIEDQDRMDLAGAVYSGLIAAGNSPHPPLTLRGGGEEGSPALTSKGDGKEVPPLKIRGGQEGLSPALARIQQRAQQRLDAMMGKGAAGARIAFLAERFSEQASSPSAIFAMGMAGAAYKLSRVAALSRLAGSPFAKPLANLFAFGVETATFTTAGKLGAATFGVKQDWSPEAWYHEWASGATMLLGLKATGALAGFAAKRYMQGPGFLERFSQVALPQVGMFGGILLGNRLAERAGFKQRVAGDTWLVDGLSTLLEFNVAGHLTRSAFGPGFQRFEQQLEFQAETLAKQNGKGEGISAGLLKKWSEILPSMEPQKFVHAMAMIGGDGSNAGRPWTVSMPDSKAPMGPQMVAMAMIDPSGGGGGGKPKASYVPTAHPRGELRSLTSDLQSAVAQYLKGLDPSNPDHLPPLDLLHAHAELVRDSLINKDFSYLKPEQWDRLAELLRPPEFKVVTKPNMKRVFINNRGEIAVRLSRAMVEEGIKPIVLVTDLEKDSSWAKKVQEMGGELRVVSLNESEPFYKEFVAEEAAKKKIDVKDYKPTAQDLYKFTYIYIDRVIADAKALKADAVHPGYGYISENAEFAKKLAENDIGLIGPSPKSMEEAGDKDVAKGNFIKVGVPVAIGTHKGYLNVEDLITEINQLLVDQGHLGFKYPLRLKAVAGGGGRGQATVYSEVELRKVFDSKKAEAEAAFKNGALMAEVFVPSFHHVEFQIIADRFGNIAIVGERECTLQVGDQKLIEIHPAEVFNRIQGLKEKMYAAAKLAAQSVNYNGHGTVEFMVNPENGDFYALEVNARIQVEHRVSELVSGVDLIREGVRVAKGLPLSFRQEDVKLQGSAVEVRIKAAKPARKWKEDEQKWEIRDEGRAGKITKFNVPKWDGVYVESSVASGDQVSPYADPMIAKIIVIGKDRAHALKRAIQVLEATQIEGERGFESDLSRQLALLKTEAVRKAYYDNNTVKNLTIQAREGEGKRLQYWEDRANLKNVQQSFLMKDGEFTPVSLEVASGVRIEEGVFEKTEAALQRLLANQENEGEFRLQGPVADLLRKTSSLRRAMTQPQTENSGKYWVQVNEQGEIRQLLFFENNRPRRIMLSQQVPFNISKIHGDAPLSRDVLYDIEFNKEGRSVESTNLYLYGEEGLHALGFFPEKGRSFFQVSESGNELTLFRMGPNLEGKGSPANLATQLKIQFIPTRLMTGLEIRNATGDLLVSVSPVKVMEDPAQKFIASVALAGEPSAPEDLKQRALQQIETLVSQLSELPSKDPLRARFIEELGTTPNSLIARLLMMMAKERPLAERALLGEIMAQREISGFSKAHTLEKYEILEPLLPQEPGSPPDPPPSMAYYTEKTPEGFVVPQVMIRARSMSSLNVLKTLQEAVAQLSVVAAERPETRSNVIQVVVKRNHGLMSSDAAFATYLEGSLQAALGEKFEDLRLDRVTFLVDRDGEYPDYFQFERKKDEQGKPTGLFVENPHERNLPDILYNLMEIGRYEKFNPERDLEYSNREIHLYYGNAKTKAGVDLRLFGAAMVNEAHVLRNVEGKLLEIPEVETGFVNLAEQMQGSLKSWKARAETRKEQQDLKKADDPAKWNRMFINVSPVMEVSDAEAMDYAVKLAERHPNDLRGLHLEKVVVKARLKDSRLPEGYRTVLIRITNPTGYQYDAQLHNVVRAKVQNEKGGIETREILINNGAFERWLQDPEWVIPAEAWAPADIPIKPMTPLEARIKSARATGGVFAYHVPRHMDKVAEKLRVDLHLQEPPDPKERLSERPPATPSFVEFELDESSVKRAPLTEQEKETFRKKGLSEAEIEKKKGKIIEQSYNSARIKPALDENNAPRPMGQNEAGVVIGEHTVDLGLKDAEGRSMPVRRVLIMGDLTHSSRGAFSEEEAARVLGALEYAEKERIPVDWVVASAGAKVDRKEGVEILDAVTATFRELVRKGRANRPKEKPPVPVNFIIDEYSIGIMSYDISAGAISSDSAGTSAMTPRGSTGLTGDKALAAASSPNATPKQLDDLIKANWPKRLQDIAGYEKVHGPNGEATFFGPDLDKALYKVLLLHYYTYSRNGDLVGKRPMLQEDPANRDITVEITSNGRTVMDEIKNVNDRRSPGNLRDVLMALRDKGSPPPLVLWEGFQGLRYPSKVQPFMKPTSVAAIAQIGGIPMMVIAKGGTVAPSDSFQIAKAIRKANALGLPVLELFSLQGFMAQTEPMQERQLTGGEDFGAANVETTVPKVVVNLGTIIGGTKVVVSKQVRLPEEQDMHRIIALDTAREQVIDGISGETVISPYRSENEKEAAQLPNVKAADATFRAAHAEANEERNPDKKTVLMAKYQTLKADYEKVFETEVTKIAQQKAKTADAHHSVERAKKQESIDRVISASELRPAIIEEMQKAIAAYERWKVQQAKAAEQKSVELGTKKSVEDPVQFDTAFRRLIEEQGWTPEEARAKLEPFAAMFEGLRASLKSNSGPGGDSSPNGSSEPPSGPGSSSAPP